MIVYKELKAGACTGELINVGGEDSGFGSVALFDA